MDELSEEDKAIVFRSRKMEKFTSQPFAVAEQFTGLKGSFVPLRYCALCAICPHLAHSLNVVRCGVTATLSRDSETSWTESMMTSRNCM